MQQAKQLSPQNSFLWKFPPSHSQGLQVRIDTYPPLEVLRTVRCPPISLLRRSCLLASRAAAEDELGFVDTGTPDLGISAHSVMIPFTLSRSLRSPNPITSVRGPTRHFSREGSHTISTHCLRTQGRDMLSKLTSSQDETNT